MLKSKAELLPRNDFNHKIIAIKEQAYKLFSVKIKETFKLLPHPQKKTTKQNIKNQFFFPINDNVYFYLIILTILNLGIDEAVAYWCDIRVQCCLSFY